MRADAKPGRARSVRTSGAGPSAMQRDFSFSSLTTMRRTGLAFSLIIASLVEFSAHHHERHLTRVGIAPGMPAADLHHDVARLQHAPPVVGDEDALAREQD